MKFKRITAPASEPLSLAEAKDHLRIETSDQDSLIAAMIQTARETVEEYLNRKLISQTWTAYFDQWSSVMELLPEVSAVNSVKYMDVSNVQQTLSTSVYELTNGTLVGGVRRKYNQDWPELLDHSDVIEIEFVCGYGADTDVPEPIKQAMKLLIGQYYENRESTVVGTINTTLDMGTNYLLAPYRIPYI